MPRPWGMAVFINGLQSISFLGIIYLEPQFYIEPIDC